MDQVSVSSKKETDHHSFLCPCYSRSNGLSDADIGMCICVCYRWDQVTFRSSRNQEKLK